MVNIATVAVVAIMFQAGNAGPVYPDDGERIGVCVDRYHTGHVIDEFDWTKLSGSPKDVWTYNYTMTIPSEKTTQYQQVWSTKPSPWKTLAIKRTAKLDPGATWLIGNEPDGIGQSNRTPEQYAEEYHEIRIALLSEDPTATIYIGGMTQPSPMRLRWLSQSIAHYETVYGEPMEFDGIHVHGYIQPEVGGSGLGQAVGVVGNSDGYEQEYWALHGDVDTFKEQIRRMRSWMKSNGYQDKPLIVSEYGILLTPGHGWPQTEVAKFLTATMPFLIQETNEDGLPADGHRLVQGAAWFSANYTIHPESVLFEGDQETLTVVGKAMRDVIASINAPTQTPTFTSTPTKPPTLLPTGTLTLLPTSTLVNTPTTTGTPTPVPPSTPTLLPTGTATVTPVATQGNTPDPTGISTTRPTTLPTEEPQEEPTSEGTRIYLPDIRGYKDT